MRAKNTFSASYLITFLFAEVKYCFGEKNRLMTAPEHQKSLAQHRQLLLISFYRLNARWRGEKEL